MDSNEALTQNLGNNLNNSEKTKRTAFYLCLIFGFLGMHKFYVKKFFSGTLCLLSLGFFGVWVIIDLFTILTNSFTDKNGNYLKNNMKWYEGLLAFIAILFPLIVFVASNPHTRITFYTSNSGVEAFNKGLTLLNQNKYEKAIESFNMAIMVDSKDFESYNNKGIALFNLEKFDESIVQFEKAINLKPSYKQAYINLGNSFKLKGDIERAIYYYDKALEIDKNYSSAYYNKASILLYYLKNYEEALKNINKAIEINSSDIDSYLLRAEIFKNIGNIGAAINDYDTTISNNNPIGYNGKCYLLLANKRYDEAIKTMDEAIAKYPDNYEFIQNKGLILMNLGKYSESIDYFDKAIQINSLNATAFCNKGLALFKLGDIVQAKLNFEKAIEIEPNNQQIQATIENILTSN